MEKLIVGIIFAILFLFNYVIYKKEDKNKNYIFSGLALIACIVCILVIIKMGLK
jgi:hypothetical protein